MWGRLLWGALWKLRSFYRHSQKCGPASPTLPCPGGDGAAHCQLATGASHAHLPLTSWPQTSAQSPACLPARPA